MEPIKDSKKIYFENLDGLRFISFLLVFLFHSFYTTNTEILQSDLYGFVTKRLFANGNLGVNFFFVLSGFLITYLLLNEKTVTGKIHPGQFWARRLLRIWPLYFLAVFIGFIGFPLLKSAFGELSQEIAHPVNYILFISNFEIIKQGLPDASVLGVLWSVGIEEQFYFIWPILLIIVNRKYWPAIFGGIIINSLVFRYLYNDFIHHEFHTFSCISDMAVGGFGAWFAFNRRNTGFFVNIPRYLIILIYTLTIGVLLFRADVLFSNPTIRVFERLFISLLFIFIILEQNYSKKSLFKLGKSKIMTRLGVISYGLYIYHFLGIIITIKLTAAIGLNTTIWHVLFLETPIALTIIISHLSYTLIEKPILKMKKLFSPTLVKKK